jgi:hypothetical protein
LLQSNCDADEAVPLLDGVRRVQAVECEWGLIAIELVRSEVVVVDCPQDVVGDSA